jgi:hypothetical protein
MSQRIGAAWALLLSVACAPPRQTPRPDGAGDARMSTGAAPGPDGGVTTMDRPPALPPADDGSTAGPAAQDAATSDAQVAGAAVGPGEPQGLPLVVTDHYENRGWFGDPGLVAQFPGSAIIEEVESAAGPCAARPPGARGKCLRFKYTPPPGLSAPASGGFVGDFFLRSLAFYHPEVAPTPRPGSPNWGVEPAVDVAPGATRLSFYAVADQPGATVVFRAGIDRDAFAVPPVTASLGTTWQPYTVSLAGAQYGSNVFAPFGWMLSDTSRPVTFYVDGIVWEGSAPPPQTPKAGPPAPMPPPPPPAVPPVTAPRPPPGKLDGVRQMMFINSCKETVWVGATGDPVPQGGGFALEAGQTTSITLPGGKWTGRFWGRTGCRFNAAGVGTCDTGGCGPRVACAGATGEPPATLVEFTLGGGGPDFYDISLVDGYNLPMAVAPMPGGFTPRPGVANDCAAPACASDLDTSCPADLRFTDAAAKVVACLSACERYRTDDLCCAGAHNSPGTCPASAYSRVFKAACPSAYSYAYDDATSTFTCQGEDYAIWFCP